VSIVLDGSVALAWQFEDEQTEPILLLLNRVVETGAIVTPLWRYEVANGLQIAIRRRRIDARHRDRALAYLAALEISIDQESETHAWSATIQLAERHGLTVYDATYLELAERRRLTLATLDEALARAARAEGIKVVP
jgi:predicted nucleic acid-binding protein